VNLYLLLSTVVPKAPVADNDADKDRAFDLPELVDEDPIASPAPTTDNNYLIVSFLQIIFAFLLFNFNNEPNAIKADAEPKKKTVPIATNDTDGDLKVEEVPEIAAVQ
jgi:hypothetical protein